MIRWSFLPEGVSSRDVQDLNFVFERLMDAFSKTEIASGRIGEFLVAASSSVTVTHVDRLFAWVRQTRSRCEACGLKSEHSTLSTSRVVTLFVKARVGKTCTVTDLYLDSCLPEMQEPSVLTAMTLRSMLWLRVLQARPRFCFCGLSGTRSRR